MPGRLSARKHSAPITLLKKECNEKEVQPYWKTDYKPMIYIRFQRQQPTRGGTGRSSDLQIGVNTSLQTVSSTVFRTRVSLQRLS